MFKRIIGGVALACTFAAATAADPGITDDKIVIGGSYPLSGHTSAYGAMGLGSATYFNYVNSELGGVKMADGKRRKIQFITLDDAFDTTRTMENAQRLVYKDKAFAMFSNVSTAGNMAIRPFLSEEGVPQLFISPATTAFASDYKKFPLTTGWALTYATEAAIYVELLKKVKPDAKLAVLVTNADGGTDFMRHFEAAIKNTNIKIVAKDVYEYASPSVETNVVNLSRSGADVFMNIATGRAASQAIRKSGEIGWRPMHIVWTGGAPVESILKPAGLHNAEGLYTALYMKDPSDPRWANDAQMKKYHEILAKYAVTGANAKDMFVMQGVALADTLVKTLERSEPNRKSVAAQARKMDNVEILGLLPGIKGTTNDGDPYLIESAQLAQFKNGAWVLQGDLLSYEGKTAK